jgi:ATP-dependent protease HslVU (ClpYQ) ATPase subunit
VQRSLAADQETTIATKHGQVKTDHILHAWRFTSPSRPTSCRAAGPPADRVELHPLSQDDFAAS